MFLLSFIIVLCSFQVSSGVMCYWCSGVGDDRDCEQHPYAVQTGPVFLNCRAHFCLSVKVIDADSGRVKSFARLCDNVPRDNVCIQDSKLLTCYESCTDDLCNSGNPDPEFLPITNYASAATKRPESKGLKGNIFGQYSDNKGVGMFKSGRRGNQQNRMNNARDRLLSNAFRGSNAGRENFKSTRRDDQVPRPRSNKNVEVVTQANLKLTKKSVKYVTDSKNKATIKTSPLNLRTSTSVSTSVTTVSHGSQLINASASTPITTLSMSESTQKLPFDHYDMKTAEITTMSEKSQMMGSNYKLAKVNDVGEKSDLKQEYKSTAKVRNPKPPKTIEYTFGASSDTGHNETTFETGITNMITPSANKVMKSSSVTKPQKDKAHITTVRVDMTGERVTNSDNKARVTKSATELRTEPPSTKIPSIPLIAPNNVANMEKPVTAIGPEKWDDLQGLEVLDDDENTFAFNSHPRNPDFPKHKHKKRTHIPSRKIESVNGIVIWPMKEDSHEDHSSSNIFNEDKEEAFIEPYRGNTTAVHLNDNLKATTKRINSSRTTDNATESSVGNSLTPSKNIGSSVTKSSTQTSPNTPITTMGSLLRKSTVSLTSGKPVLSKTNLVLAKKGNASQNYREQDKESTTKSNDNTKINPEMSTKSFEWNRSTRQYAAKLSDVWNEVGTTIIVSKQNDLPIPAEYPSFIEEELIEYPVFENEVSGWKDTTEDLMQVAGYQDENLDSSSHSYVIRSYVLCVCLMCAFIVL
ncbi:uncharacterized protein LOC126821513 [Patella vulgata]|uniref:uncharacterized protein LOC126821513 n=1 Tax=Patella vulgata TaxID=6465 RepID=UPI0021808325|nr:uncharacterized protein LOC126821513 [Patella vulgata]